MGAWVAQLATSRDHLSQRLSSLRAGLDVAEKSAGSAQALLAASRVATLHSYSALQAYDAAVDTEIHRLPTPKNSSPRRSIRRAHTYTPSPPGSAATPEHDLAKGVGGPRPPSVARRELFPTSFPTSPPSLERARSSGTPFKEALGTPYERAHSYAPGPHTEH